MPIHNDPADAPAFKDLKNHRDNFRNDDHAKKAIKDTLKGRKSTKYNSAPDSEFERLGAYRDFALWDEVTQEPGSGNISVDVDEVLVQRRLGSRFPKSDPNQSSPLPPPTFPAVQWKPPGQSNTLTIKINTEGAIDHSTGTDAEKEAAHEYMHGIFNDILHNTRTRLDAINSKLEKYMADLSGPSRNEYLLAVKHFDDYRASIQPGGSSPFATTLKSANINPVTTNEGFVVSVRIELDWKNPYHSSSTIKVP